MATYEKRVTKSGDARWRVTVRVTGHPRLSATFGRKKDAIEWAQKKERDARRGRMLGSVTVRMPVAELIDRYEADGGLDRYSGREREHRERQLAWWRDQIGEYYTPAIDAPTLSHSLRCLSAGPATRNRYLSALSRVFRWAVRSGLADSNPCAGVERYNEPDGRVRFLSDVERRRLVEACETSTDRRLLPLVLLALTTGGRLGELMALDWRDLDLERGLVTFQQTKNREKRTAPLTASVVEALEALEPRPRGKLFQRGRSLHWPRKPWYAAVEQAGLDDFHFHDLRHTFASYLAQRGASTIEIAAALGHKTLAMAKRYSHLTETHTHDLVRRMVAELDHATSRSSESRDSSS